MLILYEEYMSLVDKNVSIWLGDIVLVIIVGVFVVFKFLGVEEEGELVLEFVKSEDIVFFKREEMLGSFGVGEMIGDVDEM